MHGDYHSAQPGYVDTESSERPSLLPKTMVLMESEKPISIVGVCMEIWGLRGERCQIYPGIKSSKRGHF